MVAWAPYPCSVALALEIPELRARVVDRVGALSSESRRSLEQSLEALEQRTGHQIVVHVTPSLDGLTIEEYSMRIAEAWKVGHKGLDNGVILTVAPTEREVRIEVGYGLEGVLPDAIAARIIRERITPEFRAGNLEAGILAGVRAIESVTEGEQLPLPKRQDDFDRVAGWFKFAWIVLILLVIFLRSPLLWALFGVPRFRRGDWGGSPRWGGGFGRGGGFGGGGGFSGGGGGFGGGGASGRW